MLDVWWNLKRHADTYAGVASYVEQHRDLRLFVDDFATKTLMLSRGRPRPYDGVIGFIGPEMATIARRRKIPLVNVWVTTKAKNLVSVHPDFVAGAGLLAEHLLNRGIRRFLCLLRRGDRGESTLGQHFAEVVEQAGCQCQTHRASLLIAESHSHWNEVRTWLEDWLRESHMPVGIVTGTDFLARQVAQVCRGIDLHVPQDVAIVGGFNEPNFCLYPEPSLTSVEYSYDRVGYEAARLMHLLLLGEDVAPRTTLIAPHGLVVRNSSDFIYVDDEIVSAAMQFIAENGCGRISIDEVALAANTSRRTLEERFAKHLRRSVGGEIRRVRLEHAKRLLAGSDLTVAQIAHAAGFATAQYLARIFKQELCLSPSEYRRQHSRNEEN